VECEGNGQLLKQDGGENEDQGCPGRSNGFHLFDLIGYVFTGCGENEIGQRAGAVTEHSELFTSPSGDAALVAEELTHFPAVLAAMGPRVEDR
jgi:hypothetical protein